MGKDLWYKSQIQPDSGNGAGGLILQSKWNPLVETLGDFQNKCKTTGQWLHFRKDAHPTPQGQELIADAILKTVTLTPVRRASERIISFLLP